MFVSSAPDELVPNNNKFLRGDTLIGINRIGKRKDGKPGCYFHCISQTDVKISSWFNVVLK